MVSRGGGDLVGLRSGDLPGLMVARYHEPLEGGSGPERPVPRPEPQRCRRRKVRKILDGHVSLEVEGLDRVYLNACVPKLQL